MTKKQRQKINNARKRRYRSIVNLTGDSKLAGKLRGWSDERILNEYGITIKKKLVAIKKQRQKINNARKRRYRSIVNLTGDSKLASKLRGWSDERILNEYGITTKKKLVAIKKPKESIAKRNLSKALLYYEAAQKTYLKKKRAVIQEDYEDKVYDSEENYYDEEDKLYDEESFISSDYERFNHILRGFDPALNTQGNRRSQWKYWSNKYDKFMPQEVKEIAEWLNEKNGYDINGHYGYAVVYYAYLYGVTIEEAEQIHKADKFEGGNIYSIVKEL